jgi:hypothetical protein
VTERSQRQTGQPRPSTGNREERYGGYTPGKSSSELNRPQGLRNPPPSRPQPANPPQNQTNNPPSQS